VPVGGTWIEPDCNIPSGESLARQFLHGQRFFEREFGARCREFWNPDVFGYNGQLPQICRQAGITRFLTQKLSWNRFNKPCHHTFLWEGIDGSRVLTHFPPADTYGSRVGIHELRENVRKYKDNDRSRHSLLLFGYGDGGGGPTADMLERLRRAQSLQGLPRTTQRTSEEFFTLLENDVRDPAVVIGELYFEFHRGTYTTQAATKRGNRKGEFMLHDAEFLAAVAARTREGYAYPADELNRIWRMLLTNQFHDILPGSSVAVVYDEAERDYAEILESGSRLRDGALAALAAGAPGAVANTIGFARAEVAVAPDGGEVFVTAPACGFGMVSKAPDSVSITEDPDGFTLENAHLSARLGRDGSLLSLVERATGREALAERGNRLLMYRDEPTVYDAWDVDPFHMETETECPAAHAREVLSRGPLRAEVAFERRIGGASSMRQVVRLDAAARRIEFHCEAGWHERKKMLKVAFPVNVRAMNATYEMQFGCVERPTHFNTPYDLARYEVPGHRWSDLSEHGFGVALLSESKYGYSTFGNTMRMSLLRATEHPDPDADQGQHVFAYALMPHAGGWQESGVVAEALRFNAPLVWTGGGAPAGEPSQSLLSVDDGNIVLDTVKKAEDSEATVVRLYECHGARGRARLRCSFPVKGARLCNILEDDGGELPLSGGAVEFDYTPFQVIGIKLA
jgi:alpha-mannosidase